ncbi:sugar transferase [Pinibacter aurantiacus]|uniref:Sugar transferase n=1 Tax=Pinibacter aurantiacus TaxID=2851599 RepID=A0A9E2W3K8_9BACT|nr:sugar transferase [Pinibacter aurantiacus]MBV4356373.1 sugar transferase [Pinibacter aurantiacus]
MNIAQKEKAKALSRELPTVNGIKRPAPYARIKKKHLIAKRAFDIAFSLVVIICLLSWLLPICFILIKLDSRGPVFFKQKRVGYKGRLFSCLKLRTMVVNNLADVKQATDDDVRITRVGRFFRTTNIDELPQFFNVLFGNMSIVGPRPHMTKDCRDFSNVVASYDLRHSVKPGITGMAQTKGFRGPTNDIDSVVSRYQWDIFYVRHISFFLDLKLISITFQQTLNALVNKNKEIEELERKLTISPRPEMARVREVNKKMVV